MEGDREEEGRGVMGGYSRKVKCWFHFVYMYLGKEKERGVRVVVKVHVMHLGL